MKQHPTISSNPFPLFNKSSPQPRATLKDNQTHNSQYPNQSSSSAKFSNQENCLQLQKPRVFSVVKKELNAQDFESPIEVTFLNRIVHISMYKKERAESSSLPRQQGVKEESKVQNESRLNRLIRLAVQHFEIKLSFTEGVYLLETKSKQVVWDEKELVSTKSYFLFFTRRGYNLTKEKLRTAKSFEISLLESEIFTRGDREFRIKQSLLYDDGLVHDLFINHVKGVVDGFACPLLHCGKVFKKSGDLSLHFMTETGKKQFQCRKCGHSFYRRTDLKTHNASPCSPPSDQKQQPTDPNHHPISKQFSIPGQVQEGLTISSGENSNLAKDTNLRARRPFHSFCQEPAVTKREPDRTTNFLFSIIERQMVQSKMGIRVDSLSHKMLEIMRMTGHRGEQLIQRRVDLCYNVIFTSRLLEILKTCYPN